VPGGGGFSWGTWGSEGMRSADSGPEPESGVPTARGASVTHVSWPGVHVTGEMGTDRWGLAQRHAIDKWV
jgi:hypothetical protein